MSLSPFSICLAALVMSTLLAPAMAACEERTSPRGRPHLRLLRRHGRHRDHTPGPRPRRRHHLIPPPSGPPTPAPPSPASASPYRPLPAAPPASRASCSPPYGPTRPTARPLSWAIPRPSTTTATRRGPTSANLSLASAKAIPAKSVGLLVSTTATVPYTALTAAGDDDSPCDCSCSADGCSCFCEAALSSVRAPQLLHPHGDVHHLAGAAHQRRGACPPLSPCSTAPPPTRCGPCRRATPPARPAWAPGPPPPGRPQINSAASTVVPYSPSAVPDVFVNCALRVRSRRLSVHVHAAGGRRQRASTSGHGAQHLQA